MVTFFSVALEGLNLARILEQVPIYRRLWIGRDGHHDQSEAFDILQLVQEYGLTSDHKNTEIEDYYSRIHINRVE